MTIAERLRLHKPDGVPGEDVHPNAGALTRPGWRIPWDVLIVAALVLSSSASFGLGLLAGRESGEGKGGDDFWIENLAQQQTLPAATGAAEVAEQGVGGSSDDELATPQSHTAEQSSAPAAGGAYVASKTGTKYYLPWCGTAGRIKEENKVWFVTKAEAEAAGYEPAKNCKGL